MQLITPAALGDSTGLPLDIGLNEYTTSYDVAPTNAGIFGSGVPTERVGCPDGPQCPGGPVDDQWYRLWADRVSTILPNVVMILAGRREVANRTYKGRWINIENPTHAAYVTSQLEPTVRVAALAAPTSFS